MRINLRPRIGLLHALLSVLLIVVPMAAVAQATDETVSEPAVDGAESAPSDAPAYPAGLDDPDIALEELKFRLLPLTVDQLASLAQAWRDNAQAITQEVVDLTLRVRVASPEAVDSLKQQRALLMEERKALFEKYAAVVSSLEAKGGDPALIERLRTYRVAITVEETANLTPAEITENVLDWMISADGGIQLAIRISVIVASMIGLLLAARIVRGWARRVFQRIPNLSKLLQGFLAMVVYWLTIAVGLMIVLAALGVNITPLFALVGGASFIIAFAMQDTLGNLAAGLMIMINRPFDEGDYVTIAGKGGTVRKVSVVSTTISTRTTR